MKNEILYNLEVLLKESLTLIKGASIEKITTDYIKETNQEYLNIGIDHYLEDDEVAPRSRTIELGSVVLNPETDDDDDDGTTTDIEEGLGFNSSVSDARAVLSGGDSER